MDKIFLEISRILVITQDDLMNAFNIDHNQFDYSDAEIQYNKKIADIRQRINKFLDFQLEGFNQLINLKLNS